MTRDDNFVISDQASLDIWKHRLLSPVMTRSLPSVRFQLQALSRDRNKELSTLAMGFRDACGCAGSGFLMAATAVVLVASYFVEGNDVSEIKLMDVGYFFGFVILAALVGKVLGLFWARLRLIRLAYGLSASIPQTGHRNLSAN